MSSMIRSTVSLVLPLIVGLAAENAAVAQGRNAAAGTACARSRVAVIRQYHDSVRRSHSGGCVQLADRRTSGSRRRLFEAAVVLPRLGLDQTHSGLGHPLRGVAPHGELERQVPADGKRRRSRGARPCVDGGPAVTRLCGGPHRHWPSGRTRGFRLGGRPSGETHRLSVSCRARAHRRRQGDHGGALRGSARQVVLERLFHGRPPRAQGSAALSRRLRRDRRRRARQQLVGVDGAKRLDPTQSRTRQGSAPTSSACSRRPPSRPAMLRTA